MLFPDDCYYDMSRSSVDADFGMDRRSYLPPLRAPYDTDFNYTGRGSVQPLQSVSNQQYFQSSERMSRNSEQRLSSEFPPQNGDKLFFEELMRRQQRWVMGVMESSFRRISDDIMVC